MLEKRITSRLTTRLVCDLAAEVGFQLCGVTTTFPLPDYERYRSWTERGLAGKMGYLTDRRGDLRDDPGKVLEGVKSVVSVGMIYNGPEPYSTEFNDAERAWISRYAWGEDYHDVVRDKLNRLAAAMLAVEPFAWRACVDTAPLLERSLAKQAGLGWIGKNTCLINETVGSWFFLGELLTTLALKPGAEMPDRCGTCSRCIDACPTTAILPSPGGRFEIDSRLCIAYSTIELRGPIPEWQRGQMGANVFGCDICQDVCPWNSPRRAAVTEEEAFAPAEFAPPLEQLAGLTPEEFRAMFRDSPVSRAKYSGFLRNVAVAMGNSGLAKFRPALEKLAELDDAVVAEHARWALAQFSQ